MYTKLATLLYSTELLVSKLVGTKISASDVCQPIK